MKKFRMGMLAATPGALEALKDTDYWAYVERHGKGDWGDTSPEDKAENERSLKESLRLLSVYTLPNGKKIWIITEADRSATTILLPEEY